MMQSSLLSSRSSHIGFRLGLEIIWFRAYAELKAERSRTYLGLLWWFLEPLLLMATFYLLFDVLMHRGGPGFVEFLLCGLILWQWFRSGVQHCADSVIQARNLVREIKMPLIIFPASRLLTDTVKFSMVFLVLIAYVSFQGHPPSLAYLALPYYLVAQLALIFGIGSLLSVVIPFVPDMRSTIDPILHAGFFLSGILWTPADLPPDKQHLALFNPMAMLIQGSREVLLDGRWPDMIYPTGVLVLGTVLSFVAARMMRRWRGLYPKLPQ